eukprot:369112-Rhodomonas_salina.2
MPPPHSQNKPQEATFTFLPLHFVCGSVLFARAFMYITRSPTAPSALLCGTGCTVPRWVSCEKSASRQFRRSARCQKGGIPYRALPMDCDRPSQPASVEFPSFLCPGNKRPSE